MMDFQYNLLAKGDFVEIIFIIGFIAISAIGSIVKSAKESAEKKKSLERIKSAVKGADFHRPASKPVPKARPQNLPYAKQQARVQQRPKPVLKPRGPVERQPDIQRLADRSEPVYDRPSAVNERNAENTSKELERQQRIQQQRLVASQVQKQTAKKQKSAKKKEEVLYEAELIKDTASSKGDSIMKILSEKGSLRSAILLNEILGKPVSMRDI